MRLVQELHRKDIANPRMGLLMLRRSLRCRCRENIDTGLVRELYQETSRLVTDNTDW